MDHGFVTFGRGAGEDAGSAGALRDEHPTPDPLVAKQWGLKRIGAPRAWTRASQSEVPIAIIDTGIMEHPAIVASLGPERYNALTRENEADADGKAHGTKIASIMAAAWDGKGIMGVMNGARLLPVRAFTIENARDEFACPRPHEPCSRVLELVDAIRWAVEHGARVINASWGQRGANSRVLRDAIAAAQDRALFVVAAGHGRIDLDDDEARPFYPAAWGNELPNVLTVMQTNEADEPEGPYGKTRVHLAAPGIQIWTTDGSAGYDVVSGTSFATAFVSAAAALTWSRPAFSSHTPEQLRALLVDRAARFPRPSLAGKCRAGAVLDIGFLAET
ncbi:MAG: S8 family serine peptidase [bacterium]|nr:S8 family serine peptidase [bacterium]